MTPSRYDPLPDPYCYPGTNVLRNLAELTDQDALDLFEAEAVALQATLPLPVGGFDVAHYCQLHQHLFGAVYPWAGGFRKVRISKGGSMFCYPEHIASEMERVFGLLKDAEADLTNPDIFISRMAEFLTELNAVHPFREGNGRTQFAFLLQFADALGHKLNPQAVAPAVFLQAMIASFQGNTAPLHSALITMLESG